MTEELQVIAQEVRYWAEGHADDKDPANARDLNSWCAIASGQLYRELVAAGFEPKIRMAGCDFGSHVFVVVDDHVVDVTATQFQEFADVPVLVAHERELDMHWFYQGEEEFKTVEALIAFQKKTRWPAKQVAWAK
jgi:hypothetical protein